MQKSIPLFLFKSGSTPVFQEHLVQCIRTEAKVCGNEKQERSRIFGASLFTLEFWSCTCHHGTAAVSCEIRTALYYSCRVDHCVVACVLYQCIMAMFFRCVLALLNPFGKTSPYE